MADGQVKDARVRRTRRRLREAMVSLIHEKSYPAIVVNEILERRGREVQLSSVRIRRAVSRDAAEVKMGRRGRQIVHQHLRRVVAAQIRD